MKLPFGKPEQAHVDVDLLSTYLDNQVTSAERARVEGHLAGCASCRSELESLRRTVALLRALPRVSVPRAFTLSEAQVGIRRPAAGAPWYGSLLRGLGAVAAIVLVAFVATTLLRQTGWSPSTTVARVAPTAPIMQAEPAASAPAAPASLQEQSNVAEQPAAVAEKAAAPALAPQAAPENARPQPTAAPAAAQPTAELPVAAPTQSQVAPAPTQGLIAAAPKQSAATAAPALDTAAPAMAAAAAAGVPEVGAMATGRGGGGAGSEASLPDEVLTPEPTAPAGQISTIFPANAQLAYADLVGLWAVDRAMGVRQLAQADGLNTPQISPDGVWVAYRVTRGDHMELWGIPWNGGAPRLLLDERTLSKDGLAAEYSERRIQDTRWIPGRATLALNIVDVPSSSASSTLPKTELWYLEIETGGLRRIADLGRAYRPFYSPDGARAALLEYGTEIDPQGRLTLFNTDGGGERVALAFPASPAKPSYDSQIAWLPDSNGLWLAIPDADRGSTASFNGAALYRMPFTGSAQTMGHVDASQVAWSPDGKRMAYLRYTSAAMETSELYLANADGSVPELYAILKAGNFLSWAPNSGYFLYQDNYHIYAGAPGQAPRLLGNGVSVFDARWVATDQFVSLHDTGTGWWLTLRGLNGAATGLLSLPREAMLDVVRR